VVESVSPHVSRKYWKFQDTIAMVLWSYLFGRRSERGQTAFLHFLCCLSTNI
jgi:hypothetical protein